MNTTVYNKYKIDGWPCHFFTMEATDKYNNQMEKWSKNLPLNKKDFSINKKIQRYFLIEYLDVWDVIMYLINKKHHDVQGL